ncbi:VOC family protein [Tabrizicola sp. J26]|uniref:VOC family protein n=1 Tax=Alitabrizicola rongguiensis TaxID=2909234 RepID=UPI001F2D3513|nr:VOC family protein [Tabrizicola rongguiensis]MCF1707199.1 VOC family protein [Tabrizicola rongguiensis]
MTASLIPVLALREPAVAATLLTTVFGFDALSSGRLALGSQVIALEQVVSGPTGHGPIDHLALAVDAVPAALQAAIARGGHLDRAVTPDGPRFIPEFWTKGAAFVFLEGPEGARIEFCARPGDPRPSLPGHDHIGIACADFGAVRAFFLAQGCREVAAHRLSDATGETPVGFLEFGQSMVEIYSPPELRANPPGPVAVPHWRRLIVEGVPGFTTVAGPEGIILEGGSA